MSHPFSTFHNPLVVTTYTDNYNIRYLSILITKFLTEERKNIPNVKENISELEIIPPYITRIAHRSKMKMIEKEKNKLNFLETCLIEYERETKTLLDKYDSLKPVSQTFSFTPQSIDMSETTLQRLKVIEDFLNISRKYAPFEIKRVHQIKSLSCFQCGHQYVKSASSYQECVKCKNVIQDSGSSKSYKNSDHVSFSVDDGLINFEKTLKRYQGLQPPIPDAEWKRLKKKLDSYFRSIKFPIGKEVKKMELNSRGWRGETTRALMRKTLVILEESKHYDNVYLLGKKYWGWKLSNVQHLVPFIIYNFKAGKKYECGNQTTTDRTSGISTELRAFLELRKAGHPCEEDEFQIPENTESIQEQKSSWYWIQDQIKKEQDL